MFRLFLEIIFSLNLIHFRSFNIVQPYHKNLNKHPTSFRRPEKTSKVEQGSASWGGGGCLFEKFRVIKPTFTLLFYTVK